MCRISSNWAETSKTGLLLEWNRLHGEIPSEFLTAEICCEPYLPESEKQRYLAYRELAKAADVIITNHSLTLLHARSKEFPVLDAPDEAPISIIVADEADRIESAAELLSQRSAALISMRSLFDRNDDPSSQGIVNGIRRICDLANRVDTGRDAHVNLLNNSALTSEISFQISQLLPYFDQALKSCSDNEQIAEMALHRKSLSEFRSRLAQNSASTIHVEKYGKRSDGVSVSKAMCPVSGLATNAFSRKAAS